MTEAEERELNGYRQVKNTFEGDPELRDEWFRLYEKAFPKAVIPERQAVKAVQPKFDEQSKKIRELEEQIIKDRVSREIDEKRMKLRQAPFYFGDSDLEAVEKIVAEEGATFENAAQLYAWRNGAGSAGGPSGYVPRAAHERPEEDWRKELKNPDSPLFRDTNNYLAERSAKILKEIGPLRVHQSH